nr:hypothetical protein Iba_chr01cCG0310 [Ipomoea batatas]
MCFPNDGNVHVKDSWHRAGRRVQTLDGRRSYSRVQLLSRYNTVNVGKGCCTRETGNSEPSYFLNIVLESPKKVFEIEKPLKELLLSFPAQEIDIGHLLHQGRWPATLSSPPPSLFLFTTSSIAHPLLRRSLDKAEDLSVDYEGNLWLIIVFSCYCW